MTFTVGFAEQSFSLWSSLLPAATGILGVIIGFFGVTLQVRSAERRHHAEIQERKDRFEREQIELARLALSQIAAELFGMVFTLRRSLVKKTVNIMIDGLKKGEIVKPGDIAFPPYREDIYRTNIGDVSRVFKKQGGDLTGIYCILKDYLEKIPVIFDIVNKLDKPYNRNSSADQKGLQSLLNSMELSLLHYEDAIRAADLIIADIEATTRITVKPTWMAKNKIDMVELVDSFRE